MTVAELNSSIRVLLSREFADVWVSGEISGVKTAASGHCYFTLKDGSAQIRCACFKSSLRFLKFKPQDGVAVIARGRIDVYDARGEYQLLVETLEPQGYGALQLAFEQLKKKLAAEGLFDPARKRALPRFPRRIGIVTSPRGAVIADLVQILGRRFPGLHIRLYPALVQGEGSVEEIRRGIDYFSRSAWPDVVILARGGGSLEDLWTFNEESVARAIFNCAVPVVSAIGHETDFTIADFVADLRAPTPSAAAELVAPNREEIFERIGTLDSKAVSIVRYRLAMASRRLREQGIERALLLLNRAIGRKLQRSDDLQFRLRDLIREALEARQRAFQGVGARLGSFDPRPKLARNHARLESAHRNAVETIRTRLARRRSRLETLAAKLGQLSPLLVLDRGYAIVTGPSGEAIKDAAEAPLDSEIRVRVARGRLRATVTETGS